MFWVFFLGGGVCVQKYGYQLKRVTYWEDYGTVFILGTECFHWHTESCTADAEVHSL